MSSAHSSRSIEGHDDDRVLGPYAASVTLFFKPQQKKEYAHDMRQVSHEPVPSFTDHLTTSIYLAIYPLKAYHAIHQAKMHYKECCDKQQQTEKELEVS